MTRFRMLILLAGLVAALDSAQAQVVYPAPGEQVEVHFRYRIRAGRDERIRQFRQMTEYLKKIDFQRVMTEDSDLDIFDPTAELMNGSIATAKLPELLAEPHIQTAVVLPAGMKLPDDVNQLVPVRIRLRSGFSPQQQREFHSQASLHLQLLGFREAIGYDTRGHVLLRGALPAENVFRLLKDLRTQPTGWFAPLISPDVLPLPLRAVVPVVLVEVLNELPAEQLPAAAAPTAPSTNPAVVKLSSDIRAIVEDAEASQKPVRVEAILESPPGDDWRNLRVRLRSAVSTGSIDGLLGVVVSMRLGKAAEAIELASMPEVRSVRLPRSANETATLTAPKTLIPATDYLASSRIANLHELGYRGKAVRVVVIASGFPGLAPLIGKELPATTRYVDLTAELDLDLVAAPPVADRPGTGTVTALAIHAAAPQAELILVRIHPAAFHQLQTVSLAALGDSRFSEAMLSRSEEFVLRADLLETRRRITTEEYLKAFSDLGDDPAKEKRRVDAAAAMERLLADERAFKQVVERFGGLKAELQNLKGVGVVVNTLTWDTGYPQDGLSAISRLLEDRFTPRPVVSALRLANEPKLPIWIQPASTGLGEVWAGPFLDADGNGVMEFADPAVAIPPKRWTRELNFIGFKPTGEETPLDRLQEGMKIRITVAWREPHDPDGFLAREPVFPLNIRLFRQLDPTGQQRSSDTLQEVALSTGVPARLIKTTGSGAFEQTLEVVIPKDGVYCLRIEGGLRRDYDLPSFQRQVELYPRLVIEAGDNPTAAKGRPVFQTYLQNRSGVGIPGDTRAVVTVGTLQNRNLTGTGPGIVLGVKPELLVNGGFRQGAIVGDGTAISAGYAGGAAASLLSAGIRASDLVKTIGLKPGQELVIPLDALQRLRNPLGGN